MSYTQNAVSKYNRLKKKLPANLKQVISFEEDKVAESPQIGEKKTGDLSSVLVYKFKFAAQEYLIGYLVDESKKQVVFLAIGLHENFYRDVKKYLN